MFPEGHNNNTRLYLPPVRSLDFTALTLPLAAPGAWGDFLGSHQGNSSTRLWILLFQGSALWAALPHSHGLQIWNFGSPSCKNWDFGIHMFLRELGRRGPGHKGRVSRGPSSAPSPILGQPDRTKIRCSWPVSLCSGGYRITQEPSCESCAPEPSRATPAPSSCKCAHFAPVCCSKHPPAPGNSHVGPEPLTWVKTCAVRSDPPSGHPHILGQVISQPECDRCPKTSQSLSTAHR